MDQTGIEKLAKLAKLRIDEDQIDELSRSISDVLALVDTLSQADLGDVSPMAHPLDAIQSLREDKVTESDERDKLLSNAPAVENALFLVPKVID